MTDITDKEIEQLRRDINTLIDLAFDGCCMNKYEADLINRVKNNLAKL